MKIIKHLFFQSLLLTLVLIGFNIHAADKSICGTDVNVVLYDDGSLKTCQLKDNYDVSNVTCKSGGVISFYSNGNIESCTLYEDVTLGGITCKADGGISFFVDGKLNSCMKKED